MKAAEHIVVSTLHTGWGWLVLACSDRGLLTTTLPYESASEARSHLRLAEEVWVEEEGGDPVITLLEAYFRGEAVSFEGIALDLRGLSPFSQQVYRTLQVVPYGQRVSYQELARRAGNPRAARPVGSALARNRLPIVVPCHRVIRSDGGVGFFAGGASGTALKQRLLAMEAARTSCCD